MDAADRRTLRLLVRELRGLSESADFRWVCRLLLLRCLEVRRLALTAIPDLASLEDAQLADALDRVCEGHIDWLPELLDDSLSRPPAAVLRRCMNLIWGHEAIRGRYATAALFTPPAALGWAYQFWRAHDKKALLERIRTRKSLKVEGDDVVAATTLYTEPYMAEFLLQNSLGALWTRVRPRSSLRARWEYFIPSAEFPDQGPRSLLEWRLLDPACGAGHLLLEAFELLWALYEEDGQLVAAHDICAVILTRNLFGLDLDACAVALARVMLSLRAAEKAPGFRGRLGSVLAFTNLPAGERGSLLRVERAEKRPQPPELAILAGAYDVVVTNPPYLGPKYMGQVLREYLAECYPDTREDLQTAFLERCFELTRDEGVTATVSVKSWLYQSSFCKFRRRVLSEHTLSTFADLGPNAFHADQGLHHGVNVVLTCFWKRPPGLGHEPRGVRLGNGKGPDVKAPELRALVAGANPARQFAFPQRRLLDLPDVPFCYWLSQALIDALAEGPTLKGYVKQGLATTDNRRFLRYAWEVPHPDAHRRWFPCAKGGTYCKWAGLDYVRVNWQADGVAIKTTILEKYPYLSGWQWVAKNADYYFRPGLTYSYMCYGVLSARVLQNALFEVASIGVFPEAGDTNIILAFLNSRLASGILRALCQKHMFQAGVTEKLPLPPLTPEGRERVGKLVERCVRLKRDLLRWDLREAAADPFAPGRPWASVPSFLRSVVDEYLRNAARLHTAEAALEALVTAPFGSGQEQAVARETPPPAETLVEELSRARQLPPLDVYRQLRKDLDQRDGAAGSVLRQRATDYLTVVVLRLFGHRWPGRESPVRAPVVRSAIPLTEGCGVPTLYERIRQCLAEDFRCLVEQSESDFELLLGLPLRAWLRTKFFRYQMQRWERRPVLWQLESKPARRREPPVFACLVYYHHLDADTLGSIRRDLVAPLRDRLEAEDETCEERLEELERFAQALKEVETYGFTTSDLRLRLAQEPRDAWCSRDGEARPPATRGQFFRQEARYLPDLNDGVRVNVAPLQLAGLLAVPLLAAKDAERAVAERAEWRAAERRLCREGKLAAPAWWGVKRHTGGDTSR